MPGKAVDASTGWPTDMQRKDVRKFHGSGKAKRFNRTP